MCTWQQGVLFLAGQASQECRVFISDVGTRAIYFSLTLCTDKFIYHVLSPENELRRFHYNLIIYFELYLLADGLTPLVVRNSSINYIFILVH